MNEDTLEEMLRRQREQERAAAGRPEEKATKLTSETDEYEVYERTSSADAQPEAPAAPPTPAPPEPGPPQPSPPVFEAPPAAIPDPEPAPPVPLTPTPAPSPVPDHPDPTHALDTMSPRIALLQAEFNYDITRMMTELATSHAELLGATISHHVTVPGVYDMALVAKKLAARSDVDCIVAIGCVIQGDTGHDDIVAGHAARKLADIAYEFEKPVGFGVTGPGMTRLQAEARIGVGKNALESAVKQWRVLQGL
ncbi:MAG: 6,7-dimethyl-8-ribityllumazine synthase [Thermoplasmatota archaeon]